MSYALRSYEFWLTFYRRTWRGSVATSIVNPVFYLGALGIGLGTLVNKSGSTPDGVEYLAFVAPGVLAATAMQIASNEARRSKPSSKGRSAFPCSRNRR